MTRQVFISYASADVDIAERVRTALETAGLSCWIAPRDVEAGTDYPAAIVDGVASSTVLVVLLTEHAEASPHVLSEVGHAFNGKKRIIPFRLSSVSLSKDLDYFLSMAQWLDALDGCTDANLKRLTTAVQAAIHGEASPQVAANRPTGRRMTRIALVVVLPLALGAAAYWQWLRPPPQPKTNPKPITDTQKIEMPRPTDKTWLNPADGQEYIRIPAGTFTMGCSPADSQCAADEKPAHPVEIEKGFWLARTETTIGAYRKFAAGHGLKAPPGDGNLPLTDLTWAAAKAYCTGIGGRLPSEAEWEYAARGGKADAYYGVVPSIAWYADNSDGAVHPVGGKQPNAYGLYDMLGNVSEWVLDRYYNQYDLSSPATGAAVEQPLASNASAVARGGFWDGDAATVRVSHRAAYPNDDAEPIVGFRCASDHN
jgi:formylglycine-generating enzyme required for sulfatase activity